MSYVVVGLAGPCEMSEDEDCVSWVHGPFESRDAAREYAASVPQGFRPHIMTLDKPMQPAEHLG